jgi:hypothetical protein
MVHQLAHLHFIRLPGALRFGVFAASSGGNLPNHRTMYCCKLCNALKPPVLWLIWLLFFISPALPPLTAARRTLKLQAWAYTFFKKTQTITASVHALEGAVGRSATSRCRAARLYKTFKAPPPSTSIRGLLPGHLPFLSTNPAILLLGDLAHRFALLTPHYLCQYGYPLFELPFIIFYLCSPALVILFNRVFCEWSGT